MESFMSKRINAHETALLLALLFKRSNAKQRTRFSSKTVRTISGRKTLRVAFIIAITESLDDMGYALVEIESGFSMMTLENLNAAAAIVATGFLADIFVARKTMNGIDFDAIAEELGINEDESEDD